MMETDDKIIVGLDIGTTKTCAVVGRQNSYGKLDVLGMGMAPSYGVIQGMVNNLDKTVQAIKQCISQAAEQSSTNIVVINVGIAGDHIRNSLQRSSTIRSAKDEVISIHDVKAFTHDMYRVVVPPGSKIIHVMPQDYVIDDELRVKDPVGMTGTKLEANFNIITAKTNAISNINKCIKLSGLETEYLVLEPIASSLSVLSQEEKEAGVCLVDIGGGTTDIAIFLDGIIRHTAVIPMGGQSITQDIKEGCKVMEREAERLKTSFGKALPESAPLNHYVTVQTMRNHPPKEISCRNLALIIQARLEDIIEQVHYEVLKAGAKDKLGAGIVLTGGGALLADIRHIFEYMTGQETRIGYPNEYLGKCCAEEVKSPMFATAVGLMLVSFKSIDDREMCYIATERLQDRKGKGSLFKNIWSKAKDILIENMDDKMR